MRRTKTEKGFTLIELLLVLAIIGIVSGIAIPAYLGQRRRARVIGDAMSNSKVMAMLLETRKADNGLYGPASKVVTWTNGVPDDTTFLPSFSPAGNSKMNFKVTVGATGLTYSIECYDPQWSTSTPAYVLDQTGAETRNEK